MIVEKIPEIENLNSADKLQLVGELWNQLAEEPDTIEVSDSIVAELDRRMEEYSQDPSRVTSWEEAKARILKSKS
jgi:putative addiction module component (TIGR02574 family)